VVDAAVVGVPHDTKGTVPIAFVTLGRDVPPAELESEIGRHVLGELGGYARLDRIYVTPAMLGGTREMMLSNLVAFNVRELLNWPMAFSLATTLLAVESRSRVDSLLRIIEALDFEIDLYARLIAGRLRTDPGYHAIQTIPGVGPLLGAVFVAEIGDISRFQRPEQLASWAGLTPKHHESDTTVHRGRITKQGSRLVRWAAVEAVQRVPAHTRLGQTRDRVGQRRGRNIGAVAAARELMTLVFYGLRDHHIRCLTSTPAA